MAFRMGGLFIQAIVENGLGTFEIGSNNTFVNSLNSISITTTNGGASELELTLCPTFAQAVEIIESGFLGYGFPIESKNTVSKDSSFIKGVAQPASASALKGTGIGQSKSISITQAASIAVRIGYGDPGANDVIAKTPWIYGSIVAPTLSFGEEINITIKAVSVGVNLTSSKVIRNFSGQSLYDVVVKIYKEDINAQVEFSKEAEKLARTIIVNTNQTENSQAFIIHLLGENGFKFYESGGTAKEPQQKVMIDTLSGISNGEVKFTLVMYGQIDVANKVYPMESFSTNIDHTQVAGGFFGQKVTNLKTSDKQIDRNEYGLDTYKKDIKIAGKSVSGELKEGKSTTGGPTSGPPNLSDRTRAGDRTITVKTDNLDNRQNNGVMNETHEIMSKALTVTAICPLLPEAIPNSLVRLEIHTGNPKNPIFKTISGVYKIRQTRHTINDSGGTTELELFRELGAADVVASNASPVSDTVVPSDGVVTPLVQKLVKGLFS